MPYIIFFAAFFISLLTVPMVISIAHKTGAIALPGKRHIHTHPTPRFGGIAIAFSVLVILPFIFSFDRVTVSYITSSVLMVLLGIIDDIKGTNWKLKLIISSVAIAIIIFAGDIWIKDIGNIFGTGNIHLGMWGIPFTYFAVFGVINAINLIDGLNGLACGVSSIAFIFFATLAYMSGNNTVFFLSLLNLGATLGLFRYNYPKAKIFMGDSGSLFLGFSLAVTAILLTQGEGTINPMLPVIILGIPIYDTMRVMIIRIINRKSPFKADQKHLHHLMIRSGIHPKRVVKTIWILSFLMSILAVVLHSYESWLMLLVFSIIVGSIGVFISNLPAVRSKAKRR